MLNLRTTEALTVYQFGQIMNSVYVNMFVDKRPWQVVFVESHSYPSIQSQR